ncbi:MAG: VLRF1 family aeRF1-type release factor [Terriglobales bacterium]
MLDEHAIAALPELAAPVLTAYLDTDPANPRNQGRKGPATWIRSTARTLSAGWSAEDRDACIAQAQRVSEYLLERRGAGSRGLVVFAAPGIWRLLPLQVRVEEEIYWGTPALGQLLWLLDEHQPCGVVVVNQSGARFFRFRMGEIEEDPARPMQLDTSQWRKRTLVMGVGDEQDLFERRLEANYQRFYEGVAAACQRWSESARLEPVLLLGDTKAVEQVRAAMPEAFAARVLRADRNVTYERASEVLAAAEPLMESWKRERESKDVARLLEQRTRPDVVTGFEATLHALQEGRVRELVAVRNLRGRLRPCPSCGWVERGGPEQCPQCGHERPLQSPRAVLPKLAQAQGARVEVVAGAAAEELEHGAEGLAAWLRAA